MTDQEVFDKIVKGILAQGKQAIRNDRNTCAYRVKKDDGTVLKCAVGMLIPDDKYELRLEGFTVRELCIGESDSVEYTLAQSNMVRALQLAHDRYNCKVVNISFVETFSTRAVCIGTALGLWTSACYSSNDLYWSKNL